MSYLHGAYAQNTPSGITVPTKSGTLPVYFGAAPVHQLLTGAKVGIPVLLNSDSDATSLMGYSEDWATFSLSEAHYLHFRSSEPAGPIVFVNILDPIKHKKKTKTTTKVLFVDGVGKLPSSKVIVSSIVIADKTTGADFTSAYDAAGINVVITDKLGMMTGEISVDYFEIDLVAITDDEMSKLIRASIGLVYETANLVPTILAAPGWSDRKVINDALKNAAQAINGHWNAFVFSDIDVVQTVTPDAAKERKKGDVRNSTIEEACWPMVTDGLHFFHISTLSVVKSQIVDGNNLDSPHETTSNKTIPISGLVVGDGKGGYLPVKFDKTSGNDLNSVGIRTVIFWGGSYRLWGAHTGSYLYGSNNVAEEIFDCSVRMTQYLGNSFQLRYGDEVDKPMPRSRIDSILNSFQEWLDNLINRGALLYGKIDFLPESNVTTDMIAGEFVFDTGYTTTPPGRALVNRFRYTAAGLQSLVGGEE